MPSPPRCGLDGEVPGRSGRLHASLPLRRNAGPSWPRTETSTTRAYPRRGLPVAGPSRTTRSERARRRARASPRPPVPRESERHMTDRSTRQRSRTTTLRTRTTTHSRPTSLRLPIRSSTASRFASFPRPCTSALLIASLVPSPWSSCTCPSLPACRRPVSGLPPSRLGCPARCLFAGRGRGVQREAVDPPSSKAQAQSEIWAGGGAAAR